MTKKIFLAAVFFLPLAAGAQTTDTDAGTDVRGRASIEIDYKVFKGFHVSLEEEVRAIGNLKEFERSQTTLSASYKFNKYVKAGLGYALQEKTKNSSGAFTTRHRLMGDVTGTYRTGDWQLSLRERIQLTHRPGSMNPYQNVRNAVALKSRIGMKYRGFRHIGPYASFELRNQLNQPWGTVTSTTPSMTGKNKPYWDYEPSGYNHRYIDRYRGTLGAQFKLAEHSSLDVYCLLDSCRDYDLDTSADGSRLFSCICEDSFNISLCVGYKFSF
ncbi:MAG: DUF2490 domain-containing protein [Bacteroidales bacterium]|nr:DUF2490 domain-containing protein [Bacteroidales bacterium]